MSPKPQVSPKAAITAPPIIGPTNLALFISAELNAIAFGRSSRPPTSSMIIDCRAGPSKALTMPMQRLAAIRCQGCTRPVYTSASITSACVRPTDCATSSTLRLGMRSTHTAATGASSVIGMYIAKVARPSSSVELVSL